MTPSTDKKSAQKHSIVCKTCASPINTHSSPTHRDNGARRTNTCSLDVFGCVRRRLAILLVVRRIFIGATSLLDVGGSFGIEDTLFCGYIRQGRKGSDERAARTIYKEIGVRVECQKYVIRPPMMIANATKYSQYGR